MTNQPSQQQFTPSEIIDWNIFSKIPDSRSVKRMLKGPIDAKEKQTKKQIIVQYAVRSVGIKH